MNHKNTKEKFTVRRNSGKLTIRKQRKVAEQKTLTWRINKMCYFRTKDEELISPYELKDFLETIFNRDTAEHIIECCNQVEDQERDPKSWNAEYIEHLSQHYDSSDTVGEIDSMIDNVKDKLKKIRSKKPELQDALRGLEDIADYIHGLAVVAE